MFDRSRPFNSLPKEVGALDPMPIDASLNLKNAKIDLSRLNTIAFRAHGKTIDADHVATFGRHHQPSSITWRIGLRRADFEVLRGADNLEVGLIPLNYFGVERIHEEFTPVEVALQFYRPM